MSGAPASAARAAEHARPDQSSVPDDGRGRGPALRKASKPVPEADSLGQDIDRICHPDAPWTAVERLVGVKLRQACWFVDAEGRTLTSSEWKPGMEGRWTTNAISAREIADACGGKRKPGRKGGCSKRSVQRALRVYQLAGVITQLGGQRTADTRLCEKSRWEWNSRRAAEWLRQDRAKSWDPRTKPENCHYPRPTLHESAIESARIRAGLPTNDAKVAAAARLARRLDRRDEGLARLRELLARRESVRADELAALESARTEAGLEAVHDDAAPTPASIMPPIAAADDAAPDVAGDELPQDDEAAKRTRRRRYVRMLLRTLPPLHRFDSDRNAEMIVDSAVAAAKKRGVEPDKAQIQAALAGAAAKIEDGTWPAEIAVVRAFVKRQWPSTHEPLPTFPRPPPYVPPAELEPTAADVEEARAELAALMKATEQAQAEEQHQADAATDARLAAERAELAAQKAAAKASLADVAPAPADVDPKAARLRGLVDAAFEHARAASPASFAQWMTGIQIDGFADGVLHLTAANEFVLEWVKVNFLERIVDKLCELVGDAIELEWTLGPVVRPIVAGAAPPRVVPRPRPPQP